MGTMLYMPHRIYFWRVQNRKGGWYTTLHRATEESIRKEHPEAQRVESDCIEIKDQPAQMYHRSLHEPRGKA